MHHSLPRTGGKYGAVWKRTKGGGGRGDNERIARDAGLGIATASRLRCPIDCIVPYGMRTAQSTCVGLHHRSISRMIRYDPDIAFPTPNAFFFVFLLGCGAYLTPTV